MSGTHEPPVSALVVSASRWLAGEDGVARPADALAARRADFSGGSWRSRGNDEAIVSDLRAVSSEPCLGLFSGLDAETLKRLGGKNAPGPGNYSWNDDVHLDRRPVAQIASPDRDSLDLALPSWAPAASSLQPRAPDPQAYSNMDYETAVGRNGKLGGPKWSMEKYTPGPCRQPLRRRELAVPTRHFSMVGGAQHPSKPMPPNWSVNSPNRAMLPSNVPTWIPGLGSELRPGPGQYNFRAHRKPTTRARCSFGGRPQNLHPMSSNWVPATRGCQQPSGEHLRMRAPAKKQ